MSLLDHDLEVIVTEDGSEFKREFEDSPYRFDVRLRDLHKLRCLEITQSVVTNDDIEHLRFMFNDEERCSSELKMFVSRFCQLVCQALAQDLGG
jgi:hypothetical protein